MPKNEDGEFELVVGNKQLLSIVFILMVLFGVVFSMGYFLGRANSGDGVVAGTQAVPATQGRPDAAGAQAASAPPASDRTLQPGEAAVATPDAGTGSTVAVSNETAAPAPPPAQEPKPLVAPVKQAAPPPAAPAVSGEPAPGQTFLQVAALKKPQAEVLVEALRKKGFHASTSPVTVRGQEVFRVLVGPLKSPSEIAKTRADIEALGFPKPIVAKY